MQEFLSQGKGSIIQRGARVGGGVGLWGGPILWLDSSEPLSTLEVSRALATTYLRGRQGRFALNAQDKERGTRHNADKHREVLISLEQSAILE